MTRARDIMHDLQRVGADETVEAAARRMADLQVDALPICGPDGNVQAMQGMITEGEIDERVIGEGRDPATMLVGELPQTDTGTIAADAPIADAPAIMTEHQIGRLPVIEGFRVVGIIDHDDVERALPGA